MQDFLMVTGMVLQSGHMGEFDKRVVLLTRERGRISCFARGAVKQTNKLCARTEPFCFGTFKLHVGRSSYTILDAEIQEYFSDFRQDLIKSMYGTYFLEIASYYTRENNDEKEMLKLLYQSLRALNKEAIPDELVQYIYEMKAIVVNGEFPGAPKDLMLRADTLYTIDYVANAVLERLYTFVVSKEVLAELSKCCAKYRKLFFGDKMKSFEILHGCLSLS